MPSTITNYSALIDIAFPVSGRDNDTAGFRNNFVNIKNSLDTASDEISSMQVVQAGFAAQLNNATSATIYVNNPPPTSKGILGDKIGMIHASSATVYICYGNYTNGITDIWAKIDTSGGTW